VKKIIVTTLFSLALCNLTKASDFATEVLDATFKFFHTNSTATCVFFKREVPDQALYLVTGWHVLERTKGDTAIVVLRKRKADGAFERHDYTIPIRRAGVPLWLRHSTEDVAVLRLMEPPPVPISPLPVATLADQAQLREASLHICSPLFVLTYPRRIEANKAGFAVARQGIIASHPFQPIKNYHHFLADFTTFPGDSGGPVFVSGTDGHPLVLGIVISELRHDEKLTTEYEEHIIHHPLGLGTVLHAQFIREIIEEVAETASNDNE
jgi:hypothetical protein